MSITTSLSLSLKKISLCSADAITQGLCGGFTGATDKVTLL